MSEFLAQGGYAFFIWSAYGMAALLLVIEVVQLRTQYKAIVARVIRAARLRQQF